MSANAPFDPFAMSAVMSLAFDRELAMCIGAVQQAADYDIPKERTACFLRFHAFVTSPQPEYITAWRQDKRLERKWYSSHVNGILVDVRGALAAAHYHAGRLEKD